jgi:hypothetical protein
MYYYQYGLVFPPMNSDNILTCPLKHGHLKDEYRQIYSRLTVQHGRLSRLDDRLSLTLSDHNIIR